MSDQHGSNPTDPFQHALLEAWRICDRCTAFLIEQLPDPVWAEKLPGMPRRTIRMIAGHIHNARCMWVGRLGRECEVRPPAKVDRHRATRKQVVRALEKSGRSVHSLLCAGFDAGGTFPGRLPWMNLRPDAVQFALYLASHEAHHRGQIVMLARQLGHRLPDAVTYGLWQWNKRADEVQTD
jgi:uncharacterized damage-inducible protein DinB